MDQILKQRLVGAIVLVGVGILFLPVLFEGVPTPEEPRIETTNIPPKPETGFNSRIIPLESDAEVTVPSPPLAVSPPTPAAAPAVPGSAGAPKAAGENADTTEGRQVTATKPADKQKQEQAAGNKAQPAQKPAEKPQTQPPPTTIARAAPVEKSGQRVGVTAWVVQLGSFSSEQNAKELEARLQKQGYAAFVEKLYASDGQKYRVRIGPELVRARA